MYPSPLAPSKTTVFYPRSPLTKETQKKQDETHTASETISFTDFTRFFVPAKLMQEVTGLLPAVLFSEQDSAKTMLDLGSGAGGWVLDMAYAYPRAKVLGLDISETLVGFAQLRAQCKDMLNAVFHVADARDPHERVLEYAPFDLIHMQLAAGWLLPDEWEPLLKRYYELLSPGGRIILTEAEGLYTNSLYLNRLYSLICEAMYKEGRSPSQTTSYLGAAPRLGSLLNTCKYKNVEVTLNVLDFSSYKSSYTYQFHGLILEYLPQLRSFLLNAGVTTSKELETIIREIKTEMYHPDFYGMVHLYTFYAQK